jgi:hypothetical protein
MVFHPQDGLDGKYHAKDQLLFLVREASCADKKLLVLDIFANIAFSDE